MSSKLISRAILPLRTPALLSRSAVGLRCNSTSVAAKAAATPAAPGSTLAASDFLLPLTRDANKTAQEETSEWIEAIQDLRKEFTKDDTQAFLPNKSFGPDEFTEANLVQQAVSYELEEGKFQPTAEQALKKAQLQSAKIPAATDPTIKYLTNIIMRHGRKARAQRIMSEALYLVQLKKRVDPVQLLKDTLEKMAPILRLRRYTDGGARAEMIPVPLNERQRLRHAWTWIVEASDKRQSKSFSVRLAEEIIVASNGSGPGYEKKESVHKAGVAARSFIKKL